MYLCSVQEPSGALGCPSNGSCSCRQKYTCRDCAASVNAEQAKAALALTRSHTTVTALGSLALFADSTVSRRLNEAKLEKEEKCSGCCHAVGTVFVLPAAMSP